MDRRRITYGITFLVSGVTWLVLLPSSVLGAVLVGWFAVSMLLVGLVYLSARPRLLGKGSVPNGRQGSVPNGRQGSVPNGGQGSVPNGGQGADGSRHPIAYALLGPYFAMTWVGWWLRRFAKEPAWHEVAPGLFLGRRCEARELPPDLDAVIDVTSELGPSAGAAKRVVLEPMLDGCGIPVESLARAVSGARDARRVFVHCLAGHGRSATVAAAILLERGEAATVDEAVAKLQRVRPGVSLAPAQRESVLRWHTQGRS